MEKSDLLKLENVPYLGEDSYKELEEKILSRIKNFETQLTVEDKKRIEYELELIKNLGVAKVLLLEIELLSISEFSVSLSTENCSVVFGLCVNNFMPTLYNLPAERFLSQNTKYLSSFRILVKRREKKKIVEYVNRKYQKECFVRAIDDKTAYYLSSKPIQKAESDSFDEENISTLTTKELSSLNCFEFFIEEVENVKRLNCPLKKYSEEEIFEKQRQLFSYRKIEIPKFTLVEDISEILKDTDYRLIYQEQFMDIIEKVCGVSKEKANFYRLQFIKKSKSYLSEVKESFISAYGKEGDELFNYLYSNVKYAVLKAYVIANLYTEII